MIRALVALTAGLTAGTVYESRPIRKLRRLYCVVKLNLVTREIADTSEDILDAIEDGDAEGESALTDFYVLLCNERDELRAQLVDLTNP